MKSLHRVIVPLLLTGCATVPPKDVTANEELVQEFVHATNAHDIDRLGELVSDDFVRHCQATPDLDIRDRAGFLAFQRADLAAFPDAMVTVEHVIARDDLVAVWATYQGTQQGAMGPFPASGRRMQLDFGAVFRVDRGRIAEMWVTWDNLAALTQLGHFPPAER